MSMPVGSVNAYRCMKCGADTVTIDVDEGVTPMFLGCKATPGCDGTAQSLEYFADDIGPDPVPTYEWYRPTLKWARRKGMEVLSHVRQGGLMLRPVKK